MQSGFTLHIFSLLPLSILPLAVYCLCLCFSPSPCSLAVYCLCLCFSPNPCSLALLFIFFLYCLWQYTASASVSLHPLILIYYFVEHFYHFKILNICLFVYYLSPLPKCQAHENRDFILLFNVYKCQEYSRYIKMFCESMNEWMNIILCADYLAAPTQVELGTTPPFCFQPSCFYVRSCQ